VRKDYALRGGRPNPYAKRIGVQGRATVLARFLRSEHFVRIDEDLVEAFPDEASVNEALRIALRLNGVVRAPHRAGPASRKKKSA